MKLVIENEILYEKPVTLKLTRNNNGVIVLKANGFTLLRIEPTGIYRYNGLPRGLGFALDCNYRVCDTS